MKDFKSLKKNLRSDLSALPHVKVALLGDTATQLLATAIAGMGVERGYHFQIFEADYNQIELQLSSQSSELYEFDPEFIVIFQSSHKLLERHARLSVEQQAALSDERIDFVESIIGLPALKDKKIIYFNYAEIDDTVFGSYASKVTSSFTYVVRKINIALMEMSRRHPNLYLCDISSLQNEFGRDMMFSPNIYVATDMVLSVSILPYVASRVTDIISAIKGNFKKCLILDLDNTLWGGVIGDDGIGGIQIGHDLGIGKAFMEFQLWVRKLRQRGIIVCVVSKNEESAAKEPFEHHPDMVLSLDDIAVFLANWETKVDNIRTLQKILNIGFDSMVFIDDNPFERNIVRENIEGIVVPEMPEDPADYLEYLYSLNLFETASSSQADQDRTRQYQIEAQRVSLSKTFSNEADFLESLHMEAEVSGFDSFKTPRVAQLSQRSNQFNLRTIRYSELEIAELHNNPDVIDLAFILKDKFGDNGLVCAIVLRKQDNHTAFIESWFMSCRVLKRGMEKFTLNIIAQKAREAGYDRLVAEYIPTAKNRLVEHHYDDLGFHFLNENAQTGVKTYELLLDNYIPKNNFISLKS